MTATKTDPQNLVRHIKDYGWDGVDVEFERRRFHAHRGFDFQEAALLEESPHGAQRLRPQVQQGQKRR